MAGYVSCNKPIDIPTGRAVIPRPCPAQYYTQRIPACLVEEFSGETNPCPFLHSLLYLEDGRWHTVQGQAELRAVMNPVSNEVKAVRVVCLRQESKDTPIGA